MSRAFEATVPPSRRTGACFGRERGETVNLEPPIFARDFAANRAARLAKMSWTGLLAVRVRAIMFKREAR